MVMYQTCLPAQLLNYNGETVKASIQMQVNVIMAASVVELAAAHESNKL